MDEKVLNIEVSKLIDNSFKKVIEMVKNGDFHKKKKRILGQKLIEKPSEKNPLRKKLYYARLWPEIDKNTTLRSENQEKRAKSTEIFRNFYREYLKEKPLFIRKTEVFRLKEKIRSEREKTQIFRELKEFYKPHDLLEFKKHSDKYKSIIKENQEKRKEKIQEIKKSFRLFSSEKHWKGEFHKMVKAEILKVKVLREKSEISIKTMKKNTSMDEKRTKTQEKSRDLGLKYLDFTKKFAREKPKKTKNKSADILDKIQKPPPIIYKNYLSELRKSKKIYNKKIMPYYERWKSDFNDISLKSSEKYSKVLNKAEFLDNQAILFEKHIKYYTEDFESREKLNEILINSISAKISILRDL